MIFAKLILPVRLRIIAPRIWINPDYCRALLPLISEICPEQQHDT
jgi:hypothetical protein